MFIVKFNCKEAISTNGELVTQYGAECWLLEDQEGWVPATGRGVNFSSDLPKDVKVFKTKESAERFMKTWKGHPWYYSPNGEFAVIEVVQKYKKIFDGYEVKE